MSDGCNNPYRRAEVKYTYERSKMPKLWFVFRGKPTAGNRIAEAWSEDIARMIADALNQTQ